MGKKKLFVISAFIIFLSVSAYSVFAFDFFSRVEQDTLSLVEKSALVEEKIDEALIKHIQRDIKTIEGLTINFVNTESNNTMVEFNFKNNDELYEGVAHLQLIKDGWFVQNIDYMPIEDLTKTLTTRVLAATLKEDNLDRPFLLVSGVIKDKNIRQIKLLFHDDFTSLINVGEGINTFLDVRRGYAGGLVSVEALDKNGVVIFSE